MIIPSIDLQGGRAVQLRQGRELLLTDERDPVALAAELGRYGPVAIVDLDAALDRGDNREIVRACCQVARCRVGGGIRTHDDVRDHIRHGAAKVVIGTKADPSFLEGLPREWIVVALDARGDEVLTHGWTKGSGLSVLEQARSLAPFCSEFLFTQVEREGMLEGCDLETAMRLRNAVDRPIIVAGGIRSVEEVARLEGLGFHSQLGRAIYEGRIDLAEAWIACVSFDDRGLVPTIVQDADSGAVLMLAYGNAESLGLALRRGEGWYWSRSRERLWKKGETSGHTQRLIGARFDCDRDAVLFRVRREGPACHRGTDSCFGDAPGPVLASLERVIDDRSGSAGSASYTRSLLEDAEKLAAKLREETEEVVEATENDHVAWECADLLYHLMVRMRAADVSLGRVESELRSRFRGVDTA
jgi:phosphoribosyl-ATP pyrophosphohydrolase